MKKLLAALALITLAACQDAPAGYNPPPFAFESMPPQRINVAQIKINDVYKAPLRKPNVEHEFPVPPAVALKKWAADRLVASGSSGVMEFTIDDASVKEVPLPKTKGVKGLFTDDQDARYDARMHVTLRVYDGTDAMSKASADIEITHSRSVNEKATVQQREQIYHQMVSEMMSSFDGQATARLHGYFSNYLN